MNILRLLITLFVASTLETSYAESEGERKFPYRISLLFDGGSFVILDKLAQDRTMATRVIDQRLDSKTTGTMFLGCPGSKGARIIHKDEALKFIEGAEAALLKYWGKDEFERLKMVASDPPILDGKALHSIVSSMLHYDTCNCLFVFAKYRKQHNSEQTGTVHPAAASDSKSKGEKNPQPESEGRTR